MNPLTKKQNKVQEDELTTEDKDEEETINQSISWLTLQLSNQYML